MSDGKKLWGAEIDEDLAARADAQLEYGERAELIRLLARNVADGGADDRTPYDVTIRHYEKKREEAVRNRRAEEERVSELDEKLEDLKDERSQYDSVEERLAGRLMGVEKEKLRRGVRMDPESPKVIEIADEFDISPEAVVEKLKERNPDVPSHAFVRYHAHADDERSKPWDGLAEDLVGLPLDERERSVADED